MSEAIIVLFLCIPLAFIASVIEGWKQGSGKD